MNIPNLYQHADGGYYCLLSDDAPMKDPVNHHWIPGVIYTGVDGKMRSTTRDRWRKRFEQMAEYDGEDEEVMMMIRRCNPGSTDWDFIRVFESWHEQEANITGQMIELAVGVCLEQFMVRQGVHPAEITIMASDLQRILQTYEIKRVPIPHGYVISMSRPPGENVE